MVSGKVRRRGFATTLDNPEFQADDGSALLHAGRIVPVYRLTGRADRSDSAAGDPAGPRCGGVALSGVPAGGGGARSGPGGARRSCRSRRPSRSAHYPDDLRATATRPCAGSASTSCWRCRSEWWLARSQRRRSAVGEPVAVPAPECARRSALVEAVLTEQVRARTGPTERGASDAGPGRGRGRDRGGPGQAATDDAAAPGRRRVGQDRRGGPGPGLRGRCGPSGRAAGADGPAGAPARGGTATGCSSHWATG